MNNNARENAAIASMAWANGKRTQTFVNAPNGVDDTLSIQSALDKKGHVVIDKAGTYIVTTLLIDSDTFLDIKAGVTIKKKDGTNTNLLKNRGYVEDYRNKNIQISGGTWDCNKAGNPTSATLGLMGILLKGIDNLSITNVVEIKNEWKYAYLIVDCIDVVCDTINFNNGSDGLHFQPPIKNLVINNLTGFTDDDMISFTNGDYTNYALGITGNIENVKITNVDSNGAKEILKIVGAGTGTSIFKNFYIANLSGVVSYSIFGFPYADQTDGNIYLTSTLIENLVMENVNVSVSTATRPLGTIGASGNFIIRNVKLPKQTTAYTFLYLTSPYVGTIELDGVRGIFDAGDGFKTLVLANTTAIAKRLIVSNAYIDSPVTTQGGMIDIATGDILDVIIKDSYINWTVGSIINKAFASTDYYPIKFINCKLNAAIIGQIYAKASMYFVNTTATFSNRLLYYNDSSDVKTYFSNSPITVTANITGTRKLSINGWTAIWGGLLSLLTPQTGDILRCTYVSEPLGVGMMYYTGSEWVKIA